MIPSLVRAAAPLARPVAKKMVPALSAAALATPTLMNADESEGGREGEGKHVVALAAGRPAGRGRGFKWGGNGRDGGTDRRGRRGAAAAAERGREGNGNRCKHCFVGFRGRSFFSRNPSLTRSVDRPAVAGAKNAARMMRQRI